jgi:hypothetical protein
MLLALLFLSSQTKTALGNRVPGCQQDITKVTTAYSPRLFYFAVTPTKGRSDNDGKGLKKRKPLSHLPVLYEQMAKAVLPLVKGLLMPHLSNVRQQIA